MRSFALTLSALALGAAGAAAWYERDALLGRPAQAATQAPPAFVMPVPVVPVAVKPIPITLDYAAHTEAIRSVALQARVAGYVISQGAPDGADVKQGDLLYELDPRDYQAALDAAKAAVDRDTAALDYARASAGRGTRLADQGALSTDTADQRTATAREAEAALAADRAAVRQAELNLAYTGIRAPFDGRLSHDAAPLGTLVSASGAALNTLVQLAPLYVTFNPSETDLARIETAEAKGPVAVEVTVPGSDAAPRKGRLTFLDNAIDRTTGTITARATIGNADRSLIPGQYVHIRLLLGERPDALLVPQIALGSSQLGKFVYVVDKNHVVAQQYVTLGPSDGASVAVTKGVAAGDLVITGNLQKIGPGMPVQPISK